MFGDVLGLGFREGAWSPTLSPGVGLQVGDLAILEGERGGGVLVLASPKTLKP